MEINLYFLTFKPLMLHAIRKPALYLPTRKQCFPGLPPLGISEPIQFQEMRKSIVFVLNGPYSAWLPFSPLARWISELSRVLGPLIRFKDFDESL